MKKSRHRSFRLTQPEYMEGKRVKPRLRYLSYLGALLSSVTAISLYFGVWILFDRMGWLPAAKGNRAIVLLVIGIIHFGGTHGFILIVKRSFVWWGWMSEEESQFFLKSEGWPEEWLEPIPDHSPTATSEKESETTEEVEEIATEVQDREW